MNEFLFLYRADFATARQVSPEQAQATTQKWMDWIMGISKEGKLASRGNRLTNEGKVLKPGNVVTNGPFSELKESIGGYTIVKAASYDEAVELAKGCPVLALGGSVEVREINPL